MAAGPTVLMRHWIIWRVRVIRAGSTLIYEARYRGCRAYRAITPGGTAQEARGTRRKAGAHSFLLCRRQIFGHRAASRATTSGHTPGTCAALPLAILVASVCAVLRPAGPQTHRSAGATECADVKSTSGSIFQPGGRTGTEERRTAHGGGRRTRPCTVNPRHSPACQLFVRPADSGVV